MYFFIFDQKGVFLEHFEVGKFLEKTILMKKMTFFVFFFSKIFQLLNALKTHLFDQKNKIKKIQCHEWKGFDLK